jgi:LysM repeat protein
MTRQGFGSLVLAFGLLAGSATGCVMKEEYEAQKARSLNFQRLLAQEEKRTGELDSELKQTKRQAIEFEAKNREMNAQVKAMQEQVAKFQQDAETFREMAMREKERETARIIRPSSKVKPDPAVADLENSLTSKFGSQHGRLDTGMDSMSDMKLEGKKDSMKGMPDGPSTYHTVKRGETLYRIAKMYGMDVKALRELNQLKGNKVEVGQKLIVAQ